MTIEEDVLSILDEIAFGLSEARLELYTALAEAVVAISSELGLPELVKTYGRKKADEAWSEYITIDPLVGRAAKGLLREIRDSKALKATRPLYCGIDFSTAKSAIGPDVLGPSDEDWTSPNALLYRQAVTSLPAKLQNLDDAVNDICTIFGDLSDDYSSWFTGLAICLISATIAIAGVATAIMGVVTALPTGGGSLVLAISSLVVAVLGALAAVVAFATLPDLGVLKRTAELRLVSVAESVRNSPWSSRPSFGPGDWG